MSIRVEKALSRICVHKTDEIGGKWRKPYNADLYYLPDIIRTISWEV
jgi:hypothetical protein